MDRRAFGAEAVAYALERLRHCDAMGDEEDLAEKRASDVVSEIHTAKFVDRTIGQLLDGQFKAGPEGIDKAIAAFEQQVVPGARTQPGYMGAALIVDRQTGEAAGITRWENLESLNASERFTLEARRQDRGADRVHA